MFLTRKLSVFPGTSGLMNWLKTSLVNPSDSGSTNDLAMTFVVLKTSHGQWCWELTGPDGHVHGRSTGEFPTMEHAVASARIVQWTAPDALLTNKAGQRLEEL